MFQARPSLFGTEEPVDLAALQNEKKRTIINQPATHLPDMVVFVDHTKPMPFQLQFHAVLLFLDISGFTALCEKYALDTKNGTDQLTKTLNEYMAALVGEILNSDGDVIKFAGDAILTLWKLESFHDMNVTVNQVLCCAMNIQKKYGEWTTSVGVKLRVKIGLAAGQVSMTFLGNDEFCHYILLGRAVDAVNMAEHFCNSGDIVASPSIWCHCLEFDINHEVLDDEKHIKITSLDLPVPDEYRPQSTITVTPSMGSLVDENDILSKVATAIAAVTKSLDPSPDDGDDDDNVSNIDSELEKKSNDVIEKVRKAIIHQFDIHTEARKKLYIAKPVLRNLENKQPLEYLSEMRQVSISFINLVIHECTNIELAIILHRAFEVIYSIVSQSHGCLNKIFAFDKGSTFLVVFGLPGFKHANDSAHALLSSYEIHQELAKIKPIVHNSIGVTTGSTFCGVVGHSHRHEYTVIGSKVNMAARLMMYYPNKVTCDNETYHYSKLSKAHFRELELKKMKGLSNVGTIREYIPCAGTHITNILEENRFEYPILGRDDEMKLFVQELTNITSRPEASLREAIIFFGEAGVGKSRLLEAAVTEVMRKGIKVLTCSLTVHDLQTSLYAISSLLFDLFEFSLDMSHEQREQIILEMFRNDRMVTSHAYLLNEALQLEFPETGNLSDTERELALGEVISHVIKESTRKYGFIVFAIDDAHFMDNESWQYIHIMGKAKQSLVIATYSASFIITQSSHIVLNSINTLKVTLKGIKSTYIVGLCCQLLGVSMIPIQLERVVSERSSGIPTWCEQLLQEMIKNKILILTIVPPNYNVNMLTPPEAHITKRRVICDPNKVLDDTDYELPDMTLACIIAEGKSPSIGIPESIKGMIQTRIDHMDDMDQLVIKSAAVLGVCFSRQILEQVLPQNITSEDCGRSLKRLADSDILICGFSDPDSISHASPACLCANNQEKPHLSSMEYCQFIRFVTSTFQQTAYQMFLEKTRSSIHVKAAKLIESLSHKCTSCGGDSFMHLMWLKSSIIQKLSYRDDNADLTNTSKKKKTLAKENVDEVSGKKEHRKIGIPLTLKKLLGKVSAPVNVRKSSGSASQKVKPILMESQISSSGVEKGSSLHEVTESNDCQCIVVLTAFYAQLVRHWRATGNINKTIYYLLEASTVSMSAGDNILALSYLREVSKIVDLVKEDKNPFEGEAIVTESHTINEADEAKLHTLMGQALFHTDQMQESVGHFLKALEILGCKQTPTKYEFYQTLVKNVSTQWKRRHFSQSSTDSTSLVQPEPVIHQLRCLSHLLHWYLIRQDDLKAINTALRLVNKAECGTDLEQVIMAYICMMECCHILHKRKLGKQYRDKAHTRCVSVMEEETKDEDLQIIFLFFVTSLNKNLCWGLTEPAIESGFLAHGLGEKVKDKELKLYLLPVLTHALIMTKRFSDAVDVMKALKSIQEETNDKLTTALYHACCLDILLETGFQIEQYSRCIKYDPDISTTESVYSPANKPQNYITANIALCFIRRGEWNKAQEWIQPLEKVEWRHNDGFLLVRQFVNIVEFRLIELSKLLSANPRKSNVVTECEEGIEKDLLWLEDTCNYMEVFSPRYCHLMAYKNAIFGQNKVAKKHLNKAVKLAKKVKNMLELEWAEHSNEVWFNSNANQEQPAFWMRAGDERRLDPVTDTRIMYSLPLPHWLRN